MTSLNIKGEIGMSRVGKKPIEILDGVEVKINGRMIAVKGPKGELEYKIPNTKISVDKNDKSIIVERKSESKNVRSLHGLVRSLIQNMILGVKEGYEKKLIIEGVGFRSQVKGKILELQLGFSHPINYNIPKDIEIKIGENKELIISGIDKAKVGEVAAEIREFYKPEPYKGKGIRYENERVRRKVGKAIA